MDSCLLCLEINKVLVNCIRVDSTQWIEHDIKNLIEKHFWPLDTVESHSWLCTVCWQELSNFHKFYMRIEESHMDFGRVIKKTDVIKTCIGNGTHKTHGDYEMPFENEPLIDCHLEPEILINQPLSPTMIIEEAKFCIKQEKQELYEDDTEPKQTNKRQSVSKNVKVDEKLLAEDPLEKSKKFKSAKTMKLRNKKTKSTKNPKPSIETTPYDHAPVEAQIKQDPDALELIKEPNIPVDLNNIDNVKETDAKEPNISFDSNNSDNADSDTDSNYEQDNDYSQNKETPKKSYYKNRTNRKENDQFIAENFENMFCDLCQSPFENFSFMRKHFADKHEQKGYIMCCNKKFFGRSRLVDHIHCHFNPDQFKCDQCGKAMSGRVRLASHKRQVHGEVAKVKNHCCDICGKSFTEAFKLNLHKVTHLTEEEKKFPCTECGKFYGSAYTLNHHIQAVHLKKFAKICHICGKSLNSSTEYKAHMNKHEGKEPTPVSCDICGLRLTCERGLKRHKEAQHPEGGKKEHCCPHCPKISPTLRALKKHIKTIHERGCDHKCTICDKSFRRAETLREHMASHTGTALYTCPWCPKTFNSNGNMHSHRKKMHPKEWQEAQLQKYSGNLPIQYRSIDVTKNNTFNIS